MCQKLHIQQYHVNNQVYVCKMLELLHFILELFCLAVLWNHDYRLSFQLPILVIFGSFIREEKTHIKISFRLNWMMASFLLYYFIYTSIHILNCSCCKVICAIKSTYLPTPYLINTGSVWSQTRIDRNVNISFKVKSFDNNTTNTFYMMY